MNSRVSLLVAGAVSIDYLVYPMTLAQGEHGASPKDDDAAHLVIRAGGAQLVAQLLTAAAPTYGWTVLSPVLQASGSNALRPKASSIVDLACDGGISSESHSYSVVRLRHIGKSASWHAPPLEEATATVAPTVVITGSAEKLTSVEAASTFLEKVRAKYIVYNMTCPLAVGPLWDLIRDGPRTRDGPPDPDFLAVIIDADDLRKEGVAISQSLSWEATAEDFVLNLGKTGRLDTLATCPNLIVCFGTEGVIHHRGRDAVNPVLYYHARKTERDQRSGRQSQMVGLASAFTAGFAMGFAESKPPNSDKGLRLGISAANELARLGFVDGEVDQSPDYPIKEIMAKLNTEKGFASVSIPSGRISSGDRWTIFESVTGDPAEVARKVVTDGPEKALAQCPIQRFGKLLCVERSEQESLRAVVGAIQERLEASTPQPTSIGILGPAGSGKKFTATNLAEHLSEGRKVQKLTYNSRLLRSEDLIQACHTIRDSTASGVLTIVSFENFEAILEPNGTLLNDFLAIMRDGKFSDRGHVRTLGAPLMFFLVNQDQGGLAAPPTPMTPGTHEFKDRRTVDDGILLDYLHGVVRVIGPNQTSASDRLFCVRRALMLRHLLITQHPHLLHPTTKTIKVEEGVLHSLLLVPAYKHGLRSLDKIVATSRLSTRSKFDVAALPPEEQIQIYVDGKVFMSYLRAPKLQPALREKLAEGLFETYKQRRVEMCTSDRERADLESDRSMRDWEDLSPELKESTRSQADDIPRKLRAINCFMLQEERGDPLVRIPEFGTEDLDMLSEMEHERFNAERLQRQWRMGPRNSKQRTTPFLVPWRDLTQEWKDVDRVMVECVPRLLEGAGWRIYRMKEEA